MTKKSLPPYVYRDRGYLRFLRRSKGQSVMMKEEFDTPEFWDHYNRLRTEEKPVVEKPSKRTFVALILSYIKASNSLAASRGPRATIAYILVISGKYGGTVIHKGFSLIIFMSFIKQMPIIGGRRTILSKSWSFYSIMLGSSAF